MDVIALVFLIAGKVANIKGLMTTTIVISSVCIVTNFISSMVVKDNENKSKSMLGVVIYATLLTLSIIFRVGM